jgi:hypothetical protein
LEPREAVEPCGTPTASPVLENFARTEKRKGPRDRSQRPGGHDRKPTEEVPVMTDVSHETDTPPALEERIANLEGQVVRVTERLAGVGMLLTLPIFGSGPVERLPDSD